MLFLKGNWQFIVVGVAIILGANYFYQKHQLKVSEEKYNILKGAYETQKKYTDTIHADIEEQIKTIDAKLDKLDQADKKLSEDYKKGIEKLNKPLSQLQEEYKAATDCPSKLENANAQIAIWVEKFNLADKTIGEKDKYAFNLKTNYEAEIKLIKTDLSNERDLRLTAENKMAAGDKVIQKLKIINTAKDIALVAAITLIVVHLVIGK